MTRQTVIRAIGAALGLLAGILILTIGFWKTLLLAALAALGWFLSGARRLPAKFYEVIAGIHFPWDK